jgi:hypothetical protein
MKPIELENPKLAALTVAAGAIVFAVDLMTPMGVALPMLYPGVVLLGLWSPHPRFVLLAAIMASILSVLDFFLTPLGGIVWIGVTNRVMALLIIWLTAFLVMRYKRAEQATKTLRGLLPICAWCKKIRDDQGYWKQLEDYMEQHSEAHFTHGMCAECAAKWAQTLAKRKPTPAERIG